MVENASGARGSGYVVLLEQQKSGSASSANGARADANSFGGNNCIAHNSQLGHFSLQQQFFDRWAGYQL